MTINTGHIVATVLLSVCVLLPGEAKSQVPFEFTGGDATSALGVVTVNIDGENNDYLAQTYSEGALQVVITPSATEAHLGDYYDQSPNGVLHVHWKGQEAGGTERATIAYQSGASFDMNYFVLTTNTSISGDGAQGNEDTYIVASADGQTETFKQLLPSEDWGLSDGVTEVYLGSEFDDVKAVWFESDGVSVCLGLDRFHIDLTAPTPSTTSPVYIGEFSARPVPAVGYWWVLLAVLLTLTAWRWRGASEKYR